MAKQYLLKSTEDSRKLARSLAENLRAGDVITFRGDLGSGKTFLCREIIRNICRQDTLVASPTFNLLQIYKGQKFDIYHYDLYRLKSAEELLELGFEDALDRHVCLIEWPEIAKGFLPECTEVNLRIDGELRICDVSK